jgi:hypothetical protein
LEDCCCDLSRLPCPEAVAKGAWISPGCVGKKRLSISETVLLYRTFFPCKSCKPFQIPYSKPFSLVPRTTDNE